MGDARYIRIERLNGEPRIYRGRDTATGEHIALKVVPEEVGDEGFPQPALREAAILGELRGAPHVVTLRDVVYSLHGDVRPRVHLVLDIFGDDLSKRLRRLPAGESLPMADVKSYLAQILRGVEHCHARAIMHRDLRPQHVLVDDSGRVRLCDFSHARTIAVPVAHYTHEVVCLWYRPPELLLGAGEYGPAVDMWSVGAVFAEMMNRAPLMPGDSEIDQLMRIFRLVGTPTAASWPGVDALPDFRLSFPRWPQRSPAHACPRLDAAGADLLGKLLTPDPSARISARDALRHPFLAGVA